MALVVTGVEGVSFDDPVLSMTVVFNTTPEAPLADVSAADPTKWSAAWEGQAFIGFDVSFASYNRLAISLEVGGAAPDPDTLAYSNAPSDISDTLGRMLAAFSGQPI